MSLFRLTADITIRADDNPEVWNSVADLFDHLSLRRDKDHVRNIPSHIRSLAVDIEPVEEENATS